MWAARQALGAEVADRVMFDALELFNANTTHQEASELLLVEAEEERKRSRRSFVISAQLRDARLCTISTLGALSHL